MIHLIKPTQGLITSFFSPNRKNPVTGIYRPHSGIDIGWHGTDDDVWAAAGGICRVGYNDYAGHHVLIEHGKYTTSYSHLKSVRIRSGQRVKQGDRIGVKGTTGNSTGVHLHFELIAAPKYSENFSLKRNPLLYFVDPTTKEWQGWLKELGYYTGAVDGIYGDGTIKAVFEYQKKNKLTADGLCGRGTYAHIKKAYDSRPVKKPQTPTSPQPIEKKEANEMKLNGTTRKDIMFLNNYAVKRGIFSHRIATRKELEDAKKKSGWEKHYNKTPLEDMTDEELTNKLFSYMARKEYMQ